jgi:hypothetical protein
VRRGPARPAAFRPAHAVRCPRTTVSARAGTIGACGKTEEEPIFLDKAKQLAEQAQQKQ